MDGQRFGAGQVADPKPACAAHLDGDGEHSVERIEERHLQGHRQASAQRVHAVLRVERHDFLVLFLLLGVAQTDVFVLLVDGGDLRL